MRTVPPSTSETATELVSILRQRREVLECLLEGTTDERTLVSALDFSRRTVGRALHESEEFELIDRRVDGILPTLFARLSLAAYDEFEADVASVSRANGIDGTDAHSETEGDNPWHAADGSAGAPADLTDLAELTELVSLVTARSVFLDCARTPRDKPAFIADLGCSRSTVDRVLPRLELAGLVGWTPAGYETTPFGRALTDRYHALLAVLSNLLAARSVLRGLPVDCPLAPTLFVACDVERTDDTVPYRLLPGLRDRLESADRIRVILPTLPAPQLLDHCHRKLVDHGAALCLLADRDLLDALVTEFPGLLAAMGTGEFAASVAAVPPFGLLIADRGPETTVSILVDPNGRSAGGAIHTDADRAVAWAERYYESVRETATPATEDVRRAVADVAAIRPGTTDAADGGDTADESEKLSLSTVSDRERAEREAEGFVRLTPAYLARRAPAPPATGWRTGFDLVDVHAGYAIDRELKADNDRRSLTDDLLTRLDGGADCALVGPPGSGKSTVCKTVACRWYEQGTGPVFYRESGQGARFDSPAVLRAHLRDGVDGHALVVVEDAVRAEANAIFGVMKAFRGDPTVTFLLDAREREWRDPPNFPIDARLDAYRTEAITTRSMPALDAREAERFVTHFRETASPTLDVPLSQLLRGTDLVSTASAADGGDDGHAPAQPGTVGGPDALLVLLHRLAFYADPFAGDTTRTPTTLAEAVGGLYEDLRAAGPLALDVAVLVNLLNAAGVGVTPTLVAALAVDDSSGADDAPSTDGSPSTDPRSPQVTTSDADRFERLLGALALLDGRVLFGRENGWEKADARYRTVHEAWSALFLDRVLADGEYDASRRFGRCVTALLALADDATRRERIATALDEVGELDRIADTPTAWADATAQRIFDLGRTKPKLAPLFGTIGDPDSATLLLPAACSPEATLRCAQQRGEMSFEAGRYDRARADLERAAALLGEGSLPETPLVVDVSARNDRYRGALAQLDGDRERARERFERALASYRSVDDRFGEAKCLNLLGSLAFVGSDLDRARTCYEHSLSLLTDLRTAEETWTAPLNNLGMIALLRGDFDRAGEYLERSLAIGRDLASPFAVAYPLVNLAEVYRLRGDLDDAAECCKRALAVAREHGASDAEIRGLRCLGTIACDRGDFDRAADLLERGLALAHETDTARGIVRCRLALGVLAQARGDLAASEPHLTEALTLAREAGFRYEEGKILVALGERARGRGSPARASEFVADGVSLFREMGALRDAVESSTTLATIREEAGDVTAALACYDTAAQLARTGEFDALCASIEAQRARLAAAVREDDD